MFINKNSFLLEYKGTRTGNPKTLGLYEVSGTSFIATSNTTFQSSKVYYISMGKYVTQIEYGSNKMWGKDSGRNLKASMTGTLLGIIMKFKLSFVPLTREELEFIAPSLDSAFQKTGYYDSVKKANTVIDTYTGDWATLNKTSFEQVARANSSFDISVIATKVRS